MTYSIWSLVDLDELKFNKGLLKRRPIILDEEIELRYVGHPTGDGRYAKLCPPIEFQKSVYRLTIFPREDRTISRITLTREEKKGYNKIKTYICLDRESFSSTPIVVKW